MAEYRTSKPTFWTDDYVLSLSISGKLLYLFLMNNGFAMDNNLGITQATPQIIACVVGISADEVEAQLLRFETDKKIVRDGNKILLLNFIRHQFAGGTSTNTMLKRQYDKETSEIIRQALLTRYSDIFKQTHSPSTGGNGGIDPPSTGGNEGIDPPSTNRRGRGKGTELNQTEDSSFVNSQANLPEKRAENSEPQTRNYDKQPFTIEELSEMWNGWIDRYNLDVDHVRLTPTKKRCDKFRLRQKAFAADGAKSRDFWESLLYCVHHAQNGYYVSSTEGNSWTLTLDWLLKSDERIVRFMEAET